MTATLNPEQLTIFSGVDDCRTYLNAPWRKAGYIYATNGHIMVEIADDGRDVPAFDKHPDCAAIFAKYAPGEFGPLPALAAPVPCKFCEGKGMRTARCARTVMAMVSSTMACTTTSANAATETAGSSSRMFPKARRKVRCKACDGFGEVIDRPHKTVIGENAFATRLLRQISRLPDALIASCGESQPMWFTFDGGRGLVMPMHKD